MVAKVPAPTTLDDVERLSFANPGWQIEREADGTTTMSPTSSESGRRRLRLALLMKNWNTIDNDGEAFDSSTGFTMPAGSILSPDLSWIRRERWERLSEIQHHYAPIDPDVCIELVSSSDRIDATIAKARRYRGYGASYVVVLDGKTHTVWADGSVPGAFPSYFSTVIAKRSRDAPDPNARDANHARRTHTHRDPYSSWGSRARLLSSS